MIFRRRAVQVIPAKRVEKLVWKRHRELVADGHWRGRPILYACLVSTPFRLDGKFAYPWEEMHCLVLDNKVMLFGSMVVTEPVSVEWLYYMVDGLDLDTVTMTAEPSDKAVMLQNGMLQHDVEGRTVLLVGASDEVAVKRAEDRQPSRIARLLPLAASPSDHDAGRTLEQLAAALRSIRTSA